MTWKKASLEDLLDLSIGGIWGKEPGLDEVDVRVARVTELAPGGRLALGTAALRSVSHRQFESRKLRPGDLLLEKSGGGPRQPVGRVGIVPEGVDDSTTCSNFMQLLRPNHDVVLSRYLHLYLNHFQDSGGTLAFQTASTNIRNIKASDYLRIVVPLPGLSEQKRIVEMLDEHLSRLDAATLTVRAADKRAAMLRLSFLREQREELLSEGVPLRALGELCETALGKMLDAKRVAGKATPYLRNINVRWGSIDLGDVQTVPLSEQEQHRFALQRGDVLVCEGGEPGRCAVWTGEQSPMTFQKALHRVRSRGDMAPAFVAMMIEEFIRSGRADRLFTGTTIKHLPQEKLRAIPLPAPDRERQSTILERLASIDASVGHLRLGCARAARRSVALRRSLMCRAFAGSLTDEAAFSVAPPE